MRARIFQQPKTAMQSGRAGSAEWVFEWEPSAQGQPDPLMGWVGSRDTLAQVRLRFDTREEAVAYAIRTGADYDVELPPARAPQKPRAYADNFSVNRIDNWTH